MISSDMDDSWKSLVSAYVDLHDILMGRGPNDGFDPGNPRGYQEEGPRMEAREEAHEADHSSPVLVQDVASWTVQALNTITLVYFLLNKW